MRLVQDILSVKGNDVYSVGPDITIFEAVQMMADKSVGALLVMENHKPIGIVTERDYARKVALEGRSSRDALVKEIMSTRVLCVNPQTARWNNQPCGQESCTHRLHRPGR